MSVVFACGFVLLAAAMVVDVVGGVGRRAVRGWPYLLCGASAVLFTIVGAEGVAGRATNLSLDEFLGFGATALRVDRLSGLFLVISFAVAVPVSAVCVTWARRHPEQVRARGLASACALTFGSVAAILTANNVFCFVFAWESLTLAFYLMTAHDRTRQAHSTAAVITAVLGKLSGVSLTVGFLLLAARSGSFTLSTFAALPRSGLRDAAYLLLLIGFAVKVGILPLHVWMPRGYAAAPGPLRAVMAGVAVNVGFYGMWRTLGLLGAPPAWLVIVLLLLAAATAFLGVAHTTVQTRLTEVVAYSSVENGGLITVGYSIALVGAALSEPRLIAVGLVSATLQIVAHAVAKSLLFCAVSGIESATGTTTLDELRGVGHRLKWSGTGLAVGAITLAGLPLTLGFVSEWFLLESLMQQFRVGHLYFALPLVVAGALVALTAGFAAVAFVRIVGLTVLGPRGWDELRVRPDIGWLARCGVVVLALACVGIAAVTPLEMQVLIAGLGPIVGTDVPQGVFGDHIWVVQPVYADFSILSPSWLIIAMPVLGIATLVLAVVLGRGRFWAVRRVPAWRSATGGVAGENQYTPFGFANPTRKVLANVLLTRSELRVVERESGGRPDEVHRDAAGADLGYTSDVVEVVERFLYRPLLAPFQALVHAAKRLQNGKLEAYVGYMLIAFIAVLAVVTALA